MLIFQIASMSSVNSLQFVVYCLLLEVVTINFTNPFDYCLLKISTSKIMLGYSICICMR